MQGTPDVKMFTCAWWDSASLRREPSIPRLHLSRGVAARRRRPGLPLVALSVVEQRYQAVMTVLDGVAVAEVAAEAGVSRLSVPASVARSRDGGLAGLTSAWRSSGAATVRLSSPRPPPQPLSRQAPRRGPPPASGQAAVVPRCPLASQPWSSAARQAARNRRGTTCSARPRER